MAIVNLTPDSFSDGGQFDSSAVLSKHLRKLQDDEIPYLDFGAESTAPFNDAISFEEEKKRFEELLFPLISELDLEQTAVSIDTYKPEIFSFLYNAIKKEHPTAHLIWNDVSGVLDEKLFETLARCPDADYVFSHTNVSSRSMVSTHMETPFVVENDQLIASVIEYFESALAMFAQFDLGERIILDPCFGFSKSTEQNHLLLGTLDQVIERFPVGQRWLVGISRKSFLKALELESDESFSQREQLHSAILAHLISLLPKHNVIWRVHEPSLFVMAKRVATLFDQAL